VIEKVYSFHYQMFTGEKVFFGERPKNSHHWMVISDDIFEHRQQLMTKALQQHGLAAHLVSRWLTYEENYRSEIVKEKPISKVLFGEEVAYEGFESLLMEFSTLCDSCESEIEVGDTVRYHTRLGTVYCVKCTNLE
jgi:NAD-dependent SIR2 family protein deacetylase